MMELYLLVETSINAHTGTNIVDLFFDAMLPDLANNEAF